MSDTKLFEQPISGIICGVSGSGKTTLLIKTLKKLYDEFDSIMIFSPTCNLDPHWEELQTKKYEKKIIFDDEFEPEKIGNVMEYLKENFVKRKDDYKKWKKNTKVLIVLDDYTDELSSARHRKHPLNQLAFRGRHYGCSYLFIGHTYMSFPKTVRECSRSRILYQPSTNAEKKLICTDYASRHFDYDKLFNTLGELEDYHALAICNKDNSYTELN